MISNIEPNKAYLELIVGCMRSGKTSKLIETYKKYTFCNIPVIVINHSLDNRYSVTELVSHDGIKIPCIMVSSISDIVQETSQYKNAIENAIVVLINEGQFFPDLVENVKRFLGQKKKVYVCGLDGDFEREKMGTILELVPLCDKISKVTAICEKCKRFEAIFSKRMTNEKEKIVIGNENYSPMCRECYESEK